MERYGDWSNLAAMMFARAAEWPTRPMLRWHEKARGSGPGGWRSMNWGEFGRVAASVARRLRAAGIRPGDRVMIASENRPEFPIAETALMAIGAVTVPAYTTNTVADHAHVLHDSGARAAIVSTAAIAERVTAAGPLDLLVTMETFAAPAGTALLPWHDLAGNAGPFDDLAEEANAIAPGTLACVIYTSGTGGAPRGVMLPHRAILSNCRGAFELARPLRLDRETYLSFLPLSHAYEHTAGQFFMLSIGTEVAYARGIEHIAADMQAVRPTIMTVVPRILEAIRSRILTQMAREPAWRQRLFHRAVSVGARRAERETLTAADRALDPLLERLVRRRVRERFGGRFRAAMSGGARLEPETGRFFLGLGIALMQGYGQTEAGPVIAANPPDRSRIATVGRALAGVDLKIAPDGEVLVRGDLVMDGYWRRPDDTAEVIRDGWLHTGDVGRLDAEGYLTITDRKRDMIVLSGGENVSPARIEGLLGAEPEIAQAVVFGNGRPSLSAVLVAADESDAAAVSRAVARVNARLSITERVRRHALAAPFTIENGMLTASQKVRRHVVAREHGQVLARLDA